MLRHGGIDIRALNDIEAYLALYAFLLLLTFVHEVGHLLVGLVCGFRLVKFRVGIVELWRGDTVAQSYKQKSGKGRRWRHLFSGAVIMFATERSMKHLRLRYFSYVFAGPMANFACAFLALPIAEKRTTAGGLGKDFIIGSVLFGFINLIPFTGGEVKSDGFKLWILFFNRTKRDVLLYWLTLRARLDEVRTLCHAGNIKLACEKADEFVRLSYQLSSVIAIEEYRNRLDKFQAHFQTLASRNVDAQMDTSDLDPAMSLNLVTSGYDG